MQEGCVFCKISSGEEWGAIVWDDGERLVFMDRFPVTVGHTLVAPKSHRDDVLEMTEEEVGRLFSLAARVARAIKRSLNPAGINLLQNNGAAAGQVIFHAHVHVIPRYQSQTDNPTRAFGKNRLRVSERELLETASVIRDAMREARTL
ncbi:MAG: HIT family protein [Thaumarchaeota archaeon]|nr:HIT family protein [Candidatus Calditenuaceae archaeon]MDW8186428.1 HIT family protein [Nitrososphaerota archaeon]